MTKRLFDIVVSFGGLVLLSPVMVFVALLIRLDSPGSVLFRQERIGRGFRAFQILKFRTMVQDAQSLGGLLTAGSDHRITRVGHYLRKAKIDELPQLFNVLRGDMSFVGPRPEVARYVNRYVDEYAQLLEVRPGITDLASLKYRNESQLLGVSDDPEQTYCNEILPDKIRLSREYIRRSSFLFDLQLILQTVCRLAD